MSKKRRGGGIREAERGRRRGGEKYTHPNHPFRKREEKQLEHKRGGRIKKEG